MRINMNEKASGTDRRPHLSSRVCDGLASLDEILKEDAKFPSSKEELIHNQGWKLVDLAESKRVRASVLLKQLDDRVYRSRAEVTTSLSSLPPSKA